MRWLTAIAFVILLQGITCAEENFIKNFTQIERPLDTPNDQFPLNSVYWKDINTQDKIIYDGPYGIIVSRINNYINRWKNQTEQNYWNKSSVTYLEYNELLNTSIQKIIDNSSDMWWLRSWRESLVLQKGGYSSHTYYYGREYEILNLSGIEFSNTGRIKITNLDIKLGVDPVVLDNNNLSSTRITDKPTSTYLLGSNDSKNKITNGFGLNMFLPKSNLTQNNYYEISQQFNIGFRGNIDPNKLLNKLELKTKIKIYSKFKKDPLCQIIIINRGSPITKIYECSLSVDFIIW